MLQKSHSSDKAGYGYEIIQTLVIDIRPAANVRDAMNTINANLRLRLAAGERNEIFLMRNEIDCVFL
jgi:hypothetical protein